MRNRLRGFRLAMFTKTPPSICLPLLRLIVINDLRHWHQEFSRSMQHPAKVWLLLSWRKPVGKMQLVPRLIRLNRQAWTPVKSFRIQSSRSRSKIKWFPRNATVSHYWALRRYSSRKLRVALIIIMWTVWSMTKCPERRARTILSSIWWGEEQGRTKLMITCSNTSAFSMTLASGSSNINAYHRISGQLMSQVTEPYFFTHLLKLPTLIIIEGIRWPILLTISAVIWR